MSQTDWEDERAADLHDRMLRHGEMHRGVPGEWVGNWFFPFGVKRDDRDKHYDKSSLDDQGGDAGRYRRTLEEAVQAVRGRGRERASTDAGEGGSPAHPAGRDGIGTSPRRWRDILWRVIRRKRGG